MNRCKVCGATDLVPSLRLGVPCNWSRPDLCSYCQADAITGSSQDVTVHPVPTADAHGLESLFAEQQPGVVVESDQGAVSFPPEQLIAGLWYAYAQQITGGQIDFTSTDWIDLNVDFLRDFLAIGIALQVDASPDMSTVRVRFLGPDQAATEKERQQAEVEAALAREEGREN